VRGMEEVWNAKARKERKARKLGGGWMMLRRAVGSTEPTLRGLQHSQTHQK
jgi:hypothetical protein